MRSPLLLAILLSTGLAFAQADPVASLKADMQTFAQRAKNWTSEYFAAGDTPDGARADLVDPTPLQSIAALRPKVEAARKVDPDFATKVATILDGLQQAFEVKIQAETKCRATPACMGARIAATACAAIAARRADMQAIAEEKKNPGGAVDLVRLHGLGQEVQMLDGQIADAKKRYLATTKKPFGEQLCAAPAPASSPSSAP